MLTKRHQEEREKKSAFWQAHFMAWQASGLSAKANHLKLMCQQKSGHKITKSFVHSQTR